ncbi:MAG: E2 ligase fold family C protein, partial [Candidatus Dormibacteria bacterium]
MSLADYYSRWAMAAAQVLADFDHSEFVRRLEETALGIRFSQEAGDSPEGRALLDLLVRLTARLYPKLVLQAPDRQSPLASELVQLASRINPAIELAEGDDEASFWIGVGGDALVPEGRGVYAGSNGWIALVSADAAQPTGHSRNPFGAGAAACVAAGNAFRFIFADRSPDTLDREAALSTWRLASGAGPELEAIAVNDLTLVGVGAIGNATSWA